MNYANLLNKKPGIFDVLKNHVMHEHTIQIKAVRLSS